MKHVVIIPARNEAGRIERTLTSLLGQTSAPDRIYVVDDGSNDDTPRLVEEFGAQDQRVKLIRKTDRGFRKMGGGVVETFNEAYAQCKGEPFEYISKIDADLVFPTDYFEKIFAVMDADPKIGAASGVLFDVIGDHKELLRIPPGHVPGPLKTFRKRAFDEMGGFIAVLGWDIIDLVKLRSLGYTTRNFPELHVTHLRQHGSAEGTWKGKANWGRGAWIIGSHPLFVFLRGFYRMLEPPYIIGGLAFWKGYIEGWKNNIPRIDDKALIRALRREQLYRIFHRNRLPQ